MRKIIKIVVFLFILITLFIGINKFFQPVWTEWNNYYRTYGFYKEPENTIETIFLGTSVVVNGVIPMELYEKYGMCSYNLATESQPMLASYYWLEEAFRLHSETLKTVVLDISSLKLLDLHAEENCHKALDGMRFSYVKYKAVSDYVGDSLENMVTWMVPLFTYHSRWNSLTVNDFKRENPVNGTRGYNYSEEKYFLRKNGNVTIMNTTLNEEADESNEIQEKSLNYFLKIIQFCQKRNIQLILTKTPIETWTSGLHNAVEKYAKEYNLNFLDFNFSPLYDEIKYVHAFDSTDGIHLNYFGAVKLTNWLGKYLVENCNVTDVRGIDKYSYMEDQLELYNAQVTQRVALQSATSIQEYLSVALQSDSLVLISVKDDATAALTTNQREYFASIGLEQLSNLQFRDSYIGIIEENEVVYEETKTATEIEDGNPIVYEGILQNNIKYIVKSGGLWHGNIAYSSVDGKNYAKNGRGINIVVYSKITNAIVDSAFFDTCGFTERECYGVDTMEELLAASNHIEYDKNSVYGQVLKYYKTVKNQNILTKVQKEMVTSNFYAFFEKYFSQKDMIVLISVKDEASAKLTDEDRAKFLEYGLVELSRLGYRDSYLAYIDGGKVLYELRAEGEESVSVLDPKEDIYIKSGGANAGNISSIKINEIECSYNSRGINIVIYDKKTCSIVKMGWFDSYGNTLENYEITEEVQENLKNLQEKIVTSNFYSFLEKYITAEDMLVLISVKDEASTQLTKEDRQKFSDYGLEELSELGYRDSYLAYIDGGNVLRELRAKGEENVSMVNLEENIYIKSGGAGAGNISTIKINGVDYSYNSRGINMVIYDKKTSSVVDIACFDSYGYALGE